MRNPFEMLSGRRNAGANFSTNPFMGRGRGAGTPSTPQNPFAQGLRAQQDAGPVQQQAGPVQQQAGPVMQESISRTTPVPGPNPAYQQAPQGYPQPQDFGNQGVRISSQPQGDRSFNPFIVPSRPATQAEMDSTAAVRRLLPGASQTQMNVSLWNNQGDWTGQFDADGYPIMSQDYRDRQGQENPFVYNPNQRNQPHYGGNWWPTAGEKSLFMQGINPFSQMTEEQQQWLQRVGPYMGVPEMTGNWDGRTDVGRDFTVAQLAAQSGGDPQRATINAMLGMGNANQMRNVYNARHQWESSGQSGSTPQWDARWGGG